ncbi:ROK family protein [Bauldia sp.]|uniref:ROK family protein n=1 Tax=Bauldia sp. TaxID=2575872 RepID=UPI003BAC0D77
MKTADPELMRAINRVHVMDTIRRFGPISRTEISERTELSPTTVSAITALLLADNLIAPHAVGAIRDATRGRPRVMLELNPSAAYVVGVKLTPDQITIATTNFRADVMNALSLPIRIDRQSVPVIADLVEDGIRRSVADASLTIEGISGVCVGLPGVVERESGLCRQSPIFNTPDVPFGKELSDRLGLSVTVDTDVNLVTLAEHWFGQGRGLDDFLVVSLEHGVGLGIMHKGELFRGANGRGPDLGDLLVADPRQDGRNAPSRLADVVSTALKPNGAGNGSKSKPANAEVYRAVGDAVGMAIANLITLFAPPKVILAGAGLAIGDDLLDPLREAVASLTPSSLADVAEVVVHEWNDETWARGAAAMTLRDLYGAPWSTTGPASGPQRNGGG